MATLFNAMLETARLAGVLVGGKTTAQLNADYFYDTNRWEPDGYFNNGTVFILSGSVNLNNTRRVISYKHVNGEFYCETFDGTIVQGTLYNATNAHREALVSAVNNALIQMGEYVEIEDTATILTGAQELVLPAGVSNVLRIEYAGSRKFRIGNWREINGKILFGWGFDTAPSEPIRIYYLKSHPQVYNDNDIINPNYNLKRLAWTAAYMYLLDRMQYAGNADDKEQFLLQNAQQMAQRLALQFPVRQLERDPILARY